MNKLGWIALATVLVASQAAYADDFIERGIIRNGIDRKGQVHGDLAKQTGWSSATSINYKVVLLKTDGSKDYVDTSAYTFRFDEQFLLEVEGDSDMYIYVFYEGPDGQRTLLVPDLRLSEEPPMVAKGKKTVIPDDGTYFQFVPPAATEKLLVYALQERMPDSLNIKDFETLEPTERVKLQNQIDEFFSAARTSAKQRRDVSNLKEIELASAEESDGELRTRGPDWRMKHSKPADGTTVVAGSTNPAEKYSLYVEIPLKTSH